MSFSDIVASATSADNLFSAMYPQQSQLSGLSQAALSHGADLFTNKDYDGAIREFKRAIALDPSPDNAVQAYNLIATTYIQQNKQDEAIKAYKTSLSVSPSNDETHIKLGNIYFSQNQFNDAEKEYRAAVRISPTSSIDIYSLGQVYLATNRFSEAETLFNQIIGMAPTQYSGYYALGQTYSKEGQTDAAIKEFEKVISLKHDFNNVYVDLGSAYADLGNMDKAQEQLKVLNSAAPDLASVLDKYIAKVSKPQFMSAYNTSGFVDTLGPHTPLTSLDASLATPNASKEFNMVFIFTKAMDASTVQNLTNWSISKAPSGAAGGAYNWGLPVPSTEASISPVPLSVVYLPDSLSATVSFMVNQNAAGNGTIDPEHLMFTFFGKDAYGNAMDKSADSYSGISRMV
jgi:tetratricopeptide (TPR) repeat protein